MHFSPHGEYLTKHCIACSEKADGVICLREHPQYKGRCPIADDGPILDSENGNIVEIYYEAVGSANQVVAEDKTHVYLRPTEIEALMNLHQVESDRRGDVLKGILALQDIANRHRRARPKPKRKRTRRR